MSKKYTHEFCLAIAQCIVEKLGGQTIGNKELKLFLVANFPDTIPNVGQAGNCIEKIAKVDFASGYRRVSGKPVELSGFDWLPGQLDAKDNRFWQVPTERPTMLPARKDATSVAAPAPTRARSVIRFGEYVELVAARKDSAE